MAICRAVTRTLGVGVPLGRAVAGDHELLAGVVQRVERVEELLLGPFLVLQGLDVIHQQHVNIAVPAPGGTPASPVLPIAAVEDQS
jgi:hypothetical protein